MSAVYPGRHAHNGFLHRLPPEPRALIRPESEITNMAWSAATRRSSSAASARTRASRRARIATARGGSWGTASIGSSRSLGSPAWRARQRRRGAPG
jgi:hypothetical protein